ncbi:MAG: hypothetical protein ONB44_04695 [candidate division KSB1 bacterium]|nr:hypothetical protein [candidate division KSB1 bacterium]
MSSAKQFIDLGQNHSVLFAYPVMLTVLMLQRRHKTVNLTLLIRKKIDPTKFTAPHNFNPR